MKAIIPCVIVSAIFSAFYGATAFEFAACTLVFIVAVNTAEILHILNREAVNEDELLKAIYDRDRLLAALKLVKGVLPDGNYLKPITPEQLRDLRTARTHAAIAIAKTENK